MMSVNRYRLNYMTRKDDHRSSRVSKLLFRPDRLLGLTLLGNTFANILTSALATMIAADYFISLGILIMTVCLTLTTLIFTEAAPKTFAALHPTVFSFFGSSTLSILLLIFYRIFCIINSVANSFLRLSRIQSNKKIWSLYKLKNYVQWLMRLLERPLPVIRKC